MISKNTKPEKVPTDLRKALAAAAASVMTAWKDLTPIARRDFVSWVVGAKQAETRTRRIKVTCSKLAAGHRRPCCYAIVPMNLYKSLGANPKAKAVWKGLTPDERRDFVGWIESVKEPERGLRIEKTSRMLAAGKRHA